MAILTPPGAMCYPCQQAGPGSHTRTGGHTSPVTLKQKQAPPLSTPDLSDSDLCTRVQRNHKPLSHLSLDFLFCPRRDTKHGFHTVMMRDSIPCIKGNHWKDQCAPNANASGALVLQPTSQRCQSWENVLSSPSPFPFEGLCICHGPKEDKQIFFKSFPVRGIHPTRYN